MSKPDTFWRPTRSLDWRSVRSYTDMALTGMLLLAALHGWLPRWFLLYAAFSGLLIGLVGAVLGAVLLAAVAEKEPGA